jgi:hypothetical protein
MQLRQANTLETIESAGDEGRGEVPTRLETLDLPDFSSPSRDEVLALLKPGGDRKRTIWLVAGALIAGLGLGWVGGFSWYGTTTIPVLNQITQAETSLRRIASKSGGPTEGARKTAATLGLRTPLGVSGASQVSTIGASISAKPAATSSDGAHQAVGSSSMASPTILQADMTLNRLDSVEGTYHAGARNKTDNY